MKRTFILRLLNAEELAEILFEFVKNVEFSKNKSWTTISDRRKEAMVNIAEGIIDEFRPGYDD